MNKLLVIADRPDWAFAKIAGALKLHMTGWFVTVRFGQDPKHLADHREFDLVFYLLDYAPGMLRQAKIPAHKVALGIRSHVLENKIPDYQKTGWLHETAGAVLTANNKLFSQFSTLHHTVFLTPGGTDTSFYVPASTILNRKPVVGWAGSRSNFGYAYRGLDMLTEACEAAGLAFRPAFREDHWRSATEMRDYYQHEIDIYADMSVFAGRQNGLLEAGACGKALIATGAGISEMLLDEKDAGFLVERNTDALKAALLSCAQNPAQYGAAARRKVEQAWSWEIQVPLFQHAFEQLLRKG